MGFEFQEKETKQIFITIDINKELPKRRIVLQVEIGTLSLNFSVILYFKK